MHKSQERHRAKVGCTWPPVYTCCDPPTLRTHPHNLGDDCKHFYLGISLTPPNVIGSLAAHLLYRNTLTYLLLTLLLTYFIFLISYLPTYAAYTIA